MQSDRIKVILAIIGENLIDKAVHMESEATQILKFIRLMEGVKWIERYRGQFYWKDYPHRDRYDTVPEHTWRMAMILMILAKRLQQPLDLERALKVALVHDIPELIAGDAAPAGSDGTGRDSHVFNPEVAKERFKAEEAAAKQIFGSLPDPEGKELYDLWMEYEKQETYESKVVKAVDKLEGKMQALDFLPDKSVFPGHREFALKLGEERFNIDPILRELADMLNTEFRELKDFSPSK